MVFSLVFRPVLAYQRSFTKCKLEDLFLGNFTLFSYQTLNNIVDIIFILFRRMALLSKVNLFSFRTFFWQTANILFFQGTIF